VRDVVDGFLALCGSAAWTVGDPGSGLVPRCSGTGTLSGGSLRQAEALLAQRRRNATAAKLLKQAYQAAQGLGAVPLTSEIVALAGRARVALPDLGSRRDGGTVGEAAPASDELSTLTAREREVLALVAEGLTSKEIGRLFISERTIGVHVSHIFDKLRSVPGCRPARSTCVTGRSEAGRSAAEDTSFY
jgi:DNA-binding NarL/FixJ family response regulator